MENIQQAQPVIAKPVAEVVDTIQNATGEVAEQLSNVGQTVINNLSEAGTNVVNNVSESLEQFSLPEPTMPTASESFLNSNGLIAKFAFLVLVVIVFLILMNLGIYLLGYFLQPRDNPYLVNGMIQGTTFIDIPRDPKKAGSIMLKHSNNQKSGLEFTWSVWLNFDKNTNTQTQYSHIFSVGNNTFDSTSGLATVLNGPGVYVSNLDASGNQTQTANLHVIMDTIPDGTTFSQSTDITNLPYGKWFNVILRMKNTVLDVYINGVITNRLQFINVPKQNYEDVLICANGGFIGSLSNLRYYDYALNVFEINYVLYGGPNTSAAVVNSGNTTTKNGYNYLSNSWYANKL